MAKQYILSETDYNRIQVLLRAFEHGDFKPRYRRRNILTGGGYNFKWIKLLAASSNPMTGKEATFDGSSWSTSGDDISVYVYPQIDTTQYHTNNVILAIQKDGYWFSLYNTPAAFDEY